MDTRDYSKMHFKPSNSLSGKAKRRHSGQLQPSGLGQWRGVLERDGSTMVTATALSVIVSTIVAVPALTPLLHAAVIFPFFYTAQRRPDPAWAATIALRWLVALFLTTMIAGIFAADRVGASIPFGPGMAAAVSAWVADSGGAAPFALSHLLWGIVAFLALSSVTGGAGGFVLTSIAVTTTAYAALVLFRHGENVVQMCIASVPIWQWLLFAAVPFLLVPTSALFYARVFKVERDADDMAVTRIHMYLGAGLLAAGIVLRLALAGPWRALLSRWTLF